MATGDNVCIEVFTPGEDVTCKCSALVRGKRLVAPTTTPPTGGMLGTENINIAEAGAAALNIIGVARYEGATADQIPVITNPSSVLPLVVGAAVVAGDALKSDAQGRVIPQAGTGPVIAIALESNAVVDTDVVCRLKL